MLRLSFRCFVLTVIATTANGDDAELPDFTWPNEYYVEIEKISLTSGLVENIRTWRTPDRSRVDYNNGAVKEYVIIDDKAKYDIHPETEDDEENELICYKHPYENIFLHNVPTDMLPSTDCFSEVGEETINGKKVTKFVDENEGSYKQTWWAMYDVNHKSWIPIRYENLQYNTFGATEVHELYYFDNYKVSFDVESNFEDIEYFDCIEAEPVPDPDDEHDEVTKHLMFIDPSKEEHVDHVFKAYKRKFNRSYADDAEHSLRRSILQRNMRLVISTNRKNLGYKLAINQFSDRTHEEMKRATGLLKRKEGIVGTQPFPYSEGKLNKMSATLPDNYDLRDLGIVSRVKNQETCGSCWTFGTTAAVEGALARTNGGKLITLSNQALIDCAWPYGAAGCDGGTDTAAYNWMMDYGLPTEEEYGTYANQDGYCHINNMTKKYPISGFVDVAPNSVAALKVAIVNHGPLSVSVDATDAFSQYSGGIFYSYECNPTDLNHEITLVGYGTKNKETYWIVKNSWGPDWGVDGYIFISARDNDCGIMTEPTYVLI